MRSKLIFGHPKWPLAAILWKKSCVLIWNDEKCDQKWFSVIQNGRWQPFCEKKSCVLIWNDEKCDQKWFSVIQNGRWQLLWKNIKVAYWSEMVRNAIESDVRSSKMAAGSHFVNKIKKKKVEYWSEMARNAIKIHFWSSKIGGGGGGCGGASQWPVCKPFGDIHSICPWANTPILVIPPNEVFGDIMILLWYNNDKDQQTPGLFQIVYIWGLYPAGRYPHDICWNCIPSEH